MNGSLNALKVAILFVSLSLVSRLATAAEELIDMDLVGDDPTFFQPFDHPPDPDRGTLMRFEGYVENRIVTETGFDLQFAWRLPENPVNFGKYESGIITLPAADPVNGPVQIPLFLEHELDFSPDQVYLGLEGHSCCDNLRVVGTFTHVQVPEPASLALAVVGMFCVIAWRVRRVRMASIY